MYFERYAERRRQKVDSVVSKTCMIEPATSWLQDPACRSALVQ